MKYLLFKLANEDIPCVIVSLEMLYLLNKQEYGLIVDSDRQEFLKEVNQIARGQLSSFMTSKRKKEVKLFDLQGHEIQRLHFESIYTLKKFVSAFPEFKRDPLSSNARIRPIPALLAMLFTYSFIWAGTRPYPTDINPEGIRWRIAYLNVQFLEWLNALIGQKQILGIGIILLIILLYLVFRPEISSLFAQEMKYTNVNTRGSTDNNL